MPFPRKPAVPVVPPPRSWRQRKAFYAFVLITTTVAVYLLAKANEERSTVADPRPVTATVRCRALPTAADEPDQPTLCQRIDLPGIQQVLTSQAGVAGAIRRSGIQVAALPGERAEAALQRAATAARDQVRVAVDSTTVPEAINIAITCSCPGPQTAAGLANALAQQCAEACRAQWRASSQRVYGAAREALDRAEGDVREVKTRLDEFQQQRLLEAVDEAKKPLAAPEEPADTALPKPVENPQWAEIHEEAEGLQARRTALLVDRLPSHPAVLEVELRLRDLEARLAAIPRWTAPPNKPPVQPPTAGAAPAESAWPRATVTGIVPHAEEPDRVAAAERFQQLQREVMDAQQAQSEAGRRERRAWEALRQEPQIRLELARSDEPPAAAAFDLRLLLAAAAAAAAVTAGLGMVVAGVWMEPALASVSQVEALVPVPVAGVVPAVEPEPPVLSRQRRQSNSRIVLILSGLAVVAVCLGTLWIALGGS